MVTSLKVSITVPSLRVTMAVAPSRVIEPRVPLISQEENVEYIGHMGEVESNNFQQQRHR